MKVICFHLYNDYSGSPKVLRDVIDGLLDKGHHLSIITSKTNGVLDELIGNDNIDFDYFHYHPSSNKIIWILYFIRAQFYLFFKALKHKDGDTFYINTIMPVGAAIAGKLLGKRIIYHYHENAFIKSAFYRFLCKVMLHVADEIICVSKYQRSFLPQSNNISIVYNALPESFTNKLTANINKAFNNQNILMISSLLLYKSPLEFIDLAGELQEYNFTLVLNETNKAIKEFIDKHRITVPNNLIIYPRQSDVSFFYNNASILLNLSDPKRAIETFGLTALEGMTAGLPVIVPTVGGIAELVEDGVNGYKIDVQNLDRIALKLREILSNKQLYYNLSSAALSIASKFSVQRMRDVIESIITNKFNHE